MRISGGDARGVRLKVPPGARPTSERVRLAIFSSIAAAIPGARVLDLFCGSGAYGLEALSRGAESAVFVDRDRAALQAARENARSAGLDELCVFDRRDVAVFLASSAGRHAPFDLVFVDPPYAATDELEGVLHHLAPFVTADARVVLETRYRREPPPRPSAYLLEGDRRYGDTRVLLLRRTAEDA